MNIKNLKELYLITLSKTHKVQQYIHFIGIGGSGMGSIAEVLINKGYRISGSDLISNLITQKLTSLGAKIYYNHRPENIKNASLVVISSAISFDNPEIIAARKANIPVLCRGEILSELMRFCHGIAISGTHGKTTTTAMIFSIYFEAGLDPTCINGGLIKSIGMYARLGNSRYLIVEADESDASFLYLKPVVAIVTNIESDHMDTYHGNFENLKKTFIDFLHNLPCYGYAVMCIDDPIIREIIPYINRQIITYGCSKDADFQIKEYQQVRELSYFTLIYKKTDVLHITLNAPGLHNALNSVAAVAVAKLEDINDRTILHVLKHFKGTKRRFDFLGEFLIKLENGEFGTAILVDDYGHHPTEINATIKAARVGWPDKNLIMLFQPHRFTRTRDLCSDFVSVLSQVDVLLILDVYPAGEKFIPEANGLSLYYAIRKHGKIAPIFIPDSTQVSNILISKLTGNDLILVQGAGNIENIARNLADTKLQS